MTGSTPAFTKHTVGTTQREILMQKAARAFQSPANFQKLIHNREAMVSLTLLHGAGVIMHLEEWIKEPKMKDLVAEALATPDFISFSIANAADFSIVDRIWALIEKFDPATREKIVMSSANGNDMNAAVSLMANGKNTLRHKIYREAQQFKDRARFNENPTIKPILKSLALKLVSPQTKSPEPEPHAPKDP